MVDAVPSRVRKGSEQLPAVAVEQLVVRVARAVGQVIPRQQMELRFGQVAIGPPAHLFMAQKTSSHQVSPSTTHSLLIGASDADYLRWRIRC